MQTPPPSFHHLFLFQKEKENSLIVCDTIHLDLSPCFFFDQKNLMMITIDVSRSLFLSLYMIIIPDVTLFSWRTKDLLSLFCSFSFYFSNNPTSLSPSRIPPPPPFLLEENKHTAIHWINAIAFFFFHYFLHLYYSYFCTHTHTHTENKAHTSQMKERRSTTPSHTNKIPLLQKLTIIFPFQLFLPF